MRVFRALVFVLALVVAASAAELKVKVLDPQAAAVAGAEVSLLKKDGAPLRTATSAGDGTVSFVDVPAGDYDVQVLAPGFARLTLATAAPRADAIVAQLYVAPVTDTLVVTATRTPIPVADAGASVSALDAGQLQVMQPVATSEALRFLPGAVLSTQGQRGGLASLFVRGGDSRYNKVLIDGVPANDPGGTIDLGVFPVGEVSRLEFTRGAQSTLYGSDAMSSVVQAFSETGSTRVPELRFGADGGNLGAGHGFLNLSGAVDRWDYNFFGDQFNTSGKDVNDDYSNSLQGANVGVRLSPIAQLRVRTRHSNSRTGVQGEWDFNGNRLFPPDSNQRARTNNILGSAELTVSGPSGWQHRFTGFEYNLRRLNEDDVVQPDRVDAFDFVYKSINHSNRAGFDYQGDYSERTWAHTTVGYEFEDENGYFGDPTSISHGVRLNHAVYAQQVLQLGRLSLVGGARFVHNETFGNKGVPRVAVTFQALRGGQMFSGTRLRFSYATGIKEPRFEESFAGPFVNPNPKLQAEQNRAFETGFEQSLFSGKYSFSAIYFNNLFHNQIDFNCCDENFKGTYFNVDKALAHGAEIEFRGALASRLRFDAAYNYTSTQILDAPYCTPENFCDVTLSGPGAPKLRRPKHSATLLLSYLGPRWGANIGGSFVGRRPDSDFLFLGFDHDPAYVRADAGGWYAITPHFTAYANVENALNQHYNEVLGYPALPVNFRIGVRFRLGGE